MMLGGHPCSRAELRWRWRWWRRGLGARPGGAGAPQGLRPPQQLPQLALAQVAALGFQLDLHAVDVAPAEGQQHLAEQIEGEARPPRGLDRHDARGRAVALQGAGNSARPVVDEGQIEGGLAHDLVVEAHRGSGRLGAQLEDALHLTAGERGPRQGEADRQGCPAARGWRVVGHGRGPQRGGVGDGMAERAGFEPADPK